MNCMLHYVFAAIGGVAALTAAGCRAAVYPDPPVATYTVTSGTLPVDIYAYPRAYYDGRAVYWYGGRWYYPDGGTWRYYGREPAPLYQYRQRNYVQQAPPARGGQRYPAAPPAVRTR